LKALGARPRPIETSGQGLWIPTVVDVEQLKTENAAGLLLASPNNLTGTMALKDRCARLFGRGDRRQQLVEIFQHDGLADRLARGA
jgi:aspartate/methionine/tyrosine aminotransferase